MPFGLGRAREPGKEPAGRLTPNAKKAKNLKHQKRVEMLKKTNPGVIGWLLGKRRK